MERGWFEEEEKKEGETNNKRAAPLTVAHHVVTSSLALPGRGCGEPHSSPDKPDSPFKWSPSKRCTCVRNRGGGWNTIKGSLLGT